MGTRRSTTKNWVKRQAADPYVKKRDAAGYRSRAAFKLKEILERDRLINKGGYVVDLGASPGGWQAERLPRSAYRSRPALENGILQPEWPQVAQGGNPSRAN